MKAVLLLKATINVVSGDETGGLPVGKVRKENGRVDVQGSLFLAAGPDEGFDGESVGGDPVVVVDGTSPG